MPAADLDLLILGSGSAGLSAAVQAAAGPGLRVGVLTKAELEQSATRWAQGGVAAVLSTDEDSPDLHLADTLAAGAGLCDVDAVRVLVDEGPARVQELIALGAVFDTDTQGNLLRAREGGHSMPRIVHAGGAATGWEIERALVEAVHRSAAAVLEKWFVLDLIVEGGRCRGVVALDDKGARRDVRSTHVLVATGGAGQLFAVTTNPVQSTGDATAMGLRAGVAVADVEFMQFHPTALHHPSMPRPLLSEALRGHGALIRDRDGERFVDELLPRDQVARAITQRMLDQGADHQWLDATGLEQFDLRFPTIAAVLREVGLDPATDWLPIAPAAHHLSGGLVTDLDGATSLPGLWAAGEAACVGVHGANRLASNSLLECLVFASRVVEAIDRGKDVAEATGAMSAVLDPDASIPGRHLDVRLPQPTGDGVVEAPEKARDRLQRAMTAGAGVLRSEASLAATLATIDEIAAGVVSTGETSPAMAETRNLLDVAAALVHAARARTESRGNHWRADHLDTDPTLRLRLVQS